MYPHRAALLFIIWEVRSHIRIGLALAALALVWPGLNGLAGAQGNSRDGGSEQSAVILMYHRFGENRYPSTNVRLEQFEAHLKLLKDGNYNVRPVEDIVAHLRDGRPLPPRTVGITIDDAYLSVFTQAWPRLRRAGYPFTLFVATGPTDRGFKDIVSWNGLRQMVAGGDVTLGNHSVRHGHMATVEAAAVRAELLEATERIRAEVGAASRLFAYPYGEYGQVTRNVAVGMGFLAAFGQHSGAIGPKSDFFALPRFPINEHYGDLERLKRVLNALPLPVSEVSPADPLLTPTFNPPIIGITVDPEVGPLGNLRCYLSGQGALTLDEVRPRRFEVRPPKPFSPGRTRINCTLPAGGGRWRWYGMQMFLPRP